MESLGKYILSVVSSAMIVCIFSSFFDGKRAAGGLIRMIGGLFLAIVMLSPVARWDYATVASFARNFEAEGEMLSEEGCAVSGEAIAAIIKDRTEAYILDKASDLAADLSVTVTLGEEYPCVPESAKLSGQISPYAKRRLAIIMEQDLGIPKERQIWIG